MRAGVRAHILRRTPFLVILGLLLSLPVMARSYQARAKTTAAAANEPKQADAQGNAEQDVVQPAEPAVVTPVRKAASSSARSAGPRTSSSVAAKDVTPTPAEPELPIVPPPPEPSPEPAASTAAISAETHSTAASVVEKSEPVAPLQGLGWVEMVKTIGSVGMIICLILGGYLLFKKYGPQYMTKRPNERDIRLIETLPMGDKRSIVMVQAGAQKFLMACTPGQITLLTALNAPAATATAAANELLDPQAATAFPGSFRNFYEQEKKTASVRPSVVKALPPDIRGKMLELRKALEG